jgi:hypothetical protein
MACSLPPPMARSSTVPGVWETGQQSLFCEHGEWFSGTLPRWGSMRSGVLYQRQPPERLTAGTGSSSGRGLLKTPTAQLAVNGGSQHPDKRSAGGHGPTLADQVEHLLPTPQAEESHHGSRGSSVRRASKRQAEGRQLPVEETVVLLPTPNTLDDMPPKSREQITAHRDEGKGGDRNLREAVLYELEDEPESRWGKYEPAIRRWEEVLQRAAPEPVEPTGKDGAYRLSPEFSSWMMGLPENWVTGTGVSRKGALKAIGNGVVPLQVACAVRILLARMEYASIREDLHEMRDLQASGGFLRRLWPDGQSE